MIIKEYKFEDDLELKIDAISLVEYPAIEQDFIFFSKDFKITGIVDPGIKSKPGARPKTSIDTDTTMLLDPVYKTWKYWKMDVVNNEPWKIDTSHPFCKKHADPLRNVYTIDEIRSWSSDLTTGKNGTENGWILDSDYCDTFDGKPEGGFNLSQNLYNCRHFLSPIKNVDDLPPKYKRSRVTQHSSQKFSVDFSNINDDKMVVKGVCMIPNQLIFRLDEKNKEYFVFFSQETIKRLKESYGFNRSITIDHQDDITGNAILLKSWLYNPDDENNNDNCNYNNLKPGSWCVEYQVVNKKLWSLIKDKNIKGFSIELLVPKS